MAAVAALPATASAEYAPLAAYSFDEGEGEVAGDLTGEHDGTIEGPTWTTGKFGGALKFDGTDDCVSIPEDAQLQFLEDEEFTLEAWVRPTREDIEAIVTQQDDGADEEKEEEPWAYAMLVGGEEEPKGWLRKGGESGHVGTGGTEPLPLNAWSHIAFTDDGARIRFYVDGELVGSQPTIPLTAAEGPVTIGCNENYGNYFKGRIDEVRIYDRALDEGEVADDKTTPIETPPRSPLAAYSFDEGEGEVAGDLTGEHDGTIEGAQWARGKYGSGLKFEEEDCVSVSAISDLQFVEDQEFTLEAWVRPIGGGEADPVLAMEDESAAEGEESFSYMLLAGGEEVPKAWVRKGGEEGLQGVYGTEWLPENAWSHIAVTYDGAKLRLYVDGELVRTEPGQAVSSASGPLTIGCGWFKGRIDEVRIYDRALDEGEVADDKTTPIETPPRSPLAAYSFDEGEGEVAGDLTGEHDGTIEGPTWTTGKFGGALKFDGTDDCVSIPEDAQLQFLEDEEFTLEAWVRPTREDIEAIVTQQDDGADEEKEEEPWAYAMLVGGEEEPKGWLRKGGESGHVGTGGTEPLPLNAWSHIAFTDDGARIRFYVDGELVGSQPTIPLTAAEGPVTIGCNENYGNYFKGRIDEVRIYDRALDEGEVADDKTTPIETPPRSPLAAYSFDEGEGEVAGDLTGEHDGTIEGAQWARGKYGSGLKFEEEDCVSVSAISDLQFVEDQEFTLEAWVRPIGGGEADPVLAMEDESAAEGEESFSYMLLAGGEEVPKAWVRKGGEEGLQGVYGTEWLPENAWSHIAVTYDGAKLRLYVDGELVRTEPGQAVSLGQRPAHHRLRLVQRPHRRGPHL